MGTAAATLYLAFDGVLHPNLVSFNGRRLPQLHAGGHAFFENSVILEQVIESCPQTQVVLHTLWVPALGYRRVLEMLPQEVRLHVIGATWRGTRGLRARLRPTGARRSWLDEDLIRRRPLQPVLVDCDYRQIAPALTDSSCIVDGWYGLASAGACDRLIALLVADDVGSPLQRSVSVDRVTA
ncbi:HAD domain-containing protein [Cupriavidus necator]|uniref:HAD domain-containing protein n=1 Tax=Cupriavidus necator TaxID=106590 RepID=UPI00148FF99A|nr:HAD domain-containing protein [Cupriavidus necator]